MASRLHFYQDDEFRQLARDAGFDIAEVVRRDLAETAGIRVEIIPNREEAERLVANSKRSAILVFGPDFSKRVHASSFLAEGLNPFYRDGVKLAELDAYLLRDPTQLTAASISEIAVNFETYRDHLARLAERIARALPLDRLGLRRSAVTDQLFTLTEGADRQILAALLPIRQHRTGQILVGGEPVVGSKLKRSVRVQPHAE